VTKRLAVKSDSNNNLFNVMWDVRPYLVNLGCDATASSNIVQLMPLPPYHLLLN